jgi:hypothetical protein
MLTELGSGEVGMKQTGWAIFSLNHVSPNALCKHLWGTRNSNSHEHMCLRGFCFHRARQRVDFQACQ